jgi:hypothetical protein
MEADGHGIRVTNTRIEGVNIVSTARIKRKVSKASRVNKKGSVVLVESNHPTKLERWKTPFRWSHRLVAVAAEARHEAREGAVSRGCRTWVGGGIGSRVVHAITTAAEADCAARKSGQEEGGKCEPER